MWSIGRLALGYTEPHLKGKHINRIIFRFPTDFPVSVHGCLSLYSPAETETRTTEQYGRAVDKMNMGLFLRRRAFVVFHMHAFEVFYCLIWMNLTREVCCPCLLRFMTLI